MRDWLGEEGCWRQPIEKATNAGGASGRQAPAGRKTNDVAETAFLVAILAFGAYLYGSWLQLCASCVKFALWQVVSFR